MVRSPVPEEGSMITRTHISFERGTNRKMQIIRRCSVRRRAN